MKRIWKLLVRVIVWSSFILYLSALYYLLFIAYGRENWGDISRIDYALRNINLVPFKTIGAYIRAIRYGYMHASTPVTNLLGNFVLLMPFGFYLPLFLPGLRQWKKYIAAVVLLIFGIEATQFILMRGIFDIDDFMLNFLGAMVGFLIWKLPPIRWLERVYRREKKVW